MLPPGGVLITPILNLWRSLDQFRNDDTPFGRAWVVLAFGDAPGVTWRPAEDGYQFHQRLPHGRLAAPDAVSGRADDGRGDASPALSIGRRLLC